MKPSARLAAIALALISGVASAQQPPSPQPPAGQPAQTPAPAHHTPQRRAQPRATTARLVVRDRSGTALGDVRVVVSGPVSQEVVTDASGTASVGTIRDGSYRLRFERAGFITLEREISVSNGQPLEIAVALSAAPAPPPPPVVVAAPPPAPVAPPAPPPVASEPSGPPVFVAIPEFLDKNYIGRAPLKESVLGCLASSTTRVLQLHDALSEHAHADMDEILYVVAGEGMVRLHDGSSVVTAGSLSIIPRGVPHTIERRGKNPVIVLSTLSGAPCRAADAAQSSANRPPATQSSQR
jgi:mannose-6-phosphate isomerase-like protein (cupin superfamily)